MIADSPSLRDRDEENMRQFVFKVISAVAHDQNVTNVDGWEEQIPIVIWKIKPELISEAIDVPSD